MNFIKTNISALRFFSLNASNRNYFYDIDLHGQVLFIVTQLFLSDTFPKNLTSCYKDVKFLNFFYRRLRLVDVNGKDGYASAGDSGNEPTDLSANKGQARAIESDPHGTTFDKSLKEEQRTTDASNLQIKNDGYLHISPCGVEMNWIRVQDCPIVFNDLRDGKLVFAGDLELDFDPSSVWVNERSGRFYHPISDKLPGPSWTNLRLGLIKSSVVLCHLMDGMDDDSNGYLYEGRRYPFKYFTE